MERTKVRLLLEELESIIHASTIGNNKEPVWDGTVIGKPQQHTLEKMGLVEKSHGYYFPTEKGLELYNLFNCIGNTIPKPPLNIYEKAALLRLTLKEILDISDDWIPGTEYERRKLHIKKVLDETV